MAQMRRHQYWLHELYEGRQMYRKCYSGQVMCSKWSFFLKYFRMSREKFTYILHMVRPEIKKQKTSFQVVIPGRERLALTTR